MNRLNRVVAQVGTAGLMALLPCFAGQAIGQTVPSGLGGGGVNYALQNPLGAPRAPLYTVKFNGGTVKDYLEALRAGSNGSPMNVACTTDLLRERIDAIELDQVSLFTALNAIGAACNDPMVRWDVEPLDNPMMGPNGAMQAYKLVHMRNNPKAQQANEVKTFSLREYVGETRGDEAVKRATTLISAVEATLGIEDTGEPTWIVKFHPDSGLLIVRGTPDDLAVVTQVVAQIVSESASQEQVDRRRAMMEAERARAIDSAAKMLERANEQREMANERAIQVQKKLDGGDTAALGEIDAAVKRAQEAEEEFAFRREQYRRMEERAMFPEIAQPASTSSIARVQELEAMVEKLQKQIKELQVALSKAANGNRAR